MVDFPIDFVFPYVDSNEEQWRKQYIKYCIEHNLVSRLSNIDGERYRELGLLKYLFRSIDKFIPWVHRVYLIVSDISQVPNWINRDKVYIVLHKDIIPQCFLPTYNSTTIEMFLHKIPNLSEHFIYSNDDMYLTKPLQPEDFFTDDGLPKIDILKDELKEINPQFYQVCYNCYRDLSDKLGKKRLDNKSYVRPEHEMSPMLLSHCKQVYQLLEINILKSISNFRSDKNYNQYLYTDYAYLIKQYSCSERKFKYLALKKNIAETIDIINNQEYQMLCLNDTQHTDKQLWTNNINIVYDAFHNIGLNEISKYELSNGDKGTTKTNTSKIKKVIGIVSWFPDKDSDRQQRIDRLERLLTQLNHLLPDIPIMIIAQNWKGYQVQSIQNQDKLIIHRFVELGILGARKKLRKQFLESEFDYLIMFDDDAIIQCDDDSLIDQYLIELDNHPNGFCFIKAKKPSTIYNPYADSQLNLCAISKYIYQQVDMPDLDPQKSEGFEDRVFSYLLHIKYSEYEFDVPEGLRCVHFKNKEQPVPSTWAQKEHHDWKHLAQNTLRIEKFILENKRLPSNLKD